MTIKITRELCVAAWGSIEKGVIKHLKDNGTGRPNGCIVVVDLSIARTDSPSRDFDRAVVFVSALRLSGDFQEAAISTAHTVWLNTPNRKDGLVVFLGTAPQINEVFESWMVSALHKHAT